MNTKYALAGVGYGIGYDKLGNRVLDTKTLTDSGFNASTNVAEIRGGSGSSLQSQYFYEAQFTVSLKDCLTDFNYIAMQVGGKIKAGGDVFETETVEVKIANTITVSGNPKAWSGYGVIGWYSIGGNKDVKVISFNGKNAIVADLPVGTIVCVTYIKTDDSARVFEVASTYIPDEIHLVFTMPLYNAGATETISTSSQIGEWLIDVPRFQFNGSIDLSTTMGGSTPADISGKALASDTSTGCSNTSIYATITERIYGKDKYQNVYALVIDDSDINLSVGETQKLKVIGLYNDNTSPSPINVDDLTFTSSETDKATVDSKGLITAVAIGESIVEAVLSSKNLGCKGVVTVS